MKTIRVHNTDAGFGYTHTGKEVEGSVDIEVEQDIIDRLRDSTRHEVSFILYEILYRRGQEKNNY